MGDVPDPVMTDRSTIVALSGGATFDGLTVLFIIASTSQTGYTPQRQGWITGWVTTIGTQYGVAVGVDLPTTFYSANGVYTGVFPPTTMSISSGSLIAPMVRARFEAGQVINVRNYSASQIAFHMWLIFPT